MNIKHIITRFPLKHGALAGILFFIGLSKLLIRRLSKRGKKLNTFILMKHILIIALSLLYAGCCPCRKAVTPTIRDSVRIETHIRTEYIKDTVIIEVPIEEKAQIVRDTTSHLETSFAESDAEITPDGALRHSLRNKPQNKPVQAETKIIYRDSIIYRDRVKTETVEVERDLTWWQQTRLYGFWVLLAAVVWSLRKTILAIIRGVL